MAWAASLRTIMRGSPFFTTSPGKTKTLRHPFGVSGVEIRCSQDHLSWQSSRSRTPVLIANAAIAAACAGSSLSSNCCSLSSRGYGRRARCPFSRRISGVLASQVKLVPGKHHTVAASCRIRPASAIFRLRDRKTPACASVAGESITVDSIEWQMTDERFHILQCARVASYRLFLRFSKRYFRAASPNVRAGRSPYTKPPVVRVVDVGGSVPLPRGRQFPCSRIGVHIVSRACRCTRCSYRRRGSVWISQKTILS